MSHLPPPHLDQIAVAKWIELLVILEGRGPLDAATLDGLGCYAAAFSQWANATAQVKELGSVIRSPSGFAIESPFVKIAERAARAMKQWGDVLQLHRKAKPQAIEQPADGGGFLRLLGGRGKVG